MKTLLLSFSFLILFFTSSISQSFEWVHLNSVDYEYNPGMIQFTTCADPQGGSCFFGIKEHKTFYNQSMGDLFLEKYDEAGELQWSRTVSGESNAAGVACDAAGDVYFFGQMYQNTNFWGEDSLVKTGIGTDGFLAKANQQGELEWCKSLTDPPYGEVTVENLAFDEQGNVYVAYSTWINSYIMIINSSGEFIQSIVQENVNLASGIDIDPDGNIIVCGSCAGWSAKFNGESHPAPFSYTTYIVKYNSSFQPLWVKYIEDVTCTFPQVKTDDSGGIYFAGPLMTGTSFDDITVNGPTWSYDFFLARLTPEGEYEWVKECPEVVTGDASVGSLHFLDTDAVGNALLAGTTRGVVDWGNGVISDVTGNYEDIILWSYNAEGDVNWVKTAGGLGYDLLHSVSAGPGGVAYLAGIVSGTAEFDSITVTTTGSIDPYLAKIDYDLSAGIDDQGLADDVKVYPNPASDRMHIISNPEMSSYSIYNYSGQKVLSGKLTNSDSWIQLSGMPAGFYILELKDENGLRKSVPFLIE